MPVSSRFKGSRDSFGNGVVIGDNFKFFVNYFRGFDNCVFLGDKLEKFLWWLMLVKQRKKTTTMIQKPNSSFRGSSQARRPPKRSYKLRIQEGIDAWRSAHREANWYSTVTAGAIEITLVSSGRSIVFTEQAEPDLDCRVVRKRQKW